MKSVFVKIFLLTVVVLLAYTYIGQVVPQYHHGNPTPETPKITPGTSPQDLVEIGENLVETHGCTACHFIGGNEKGRCPNLEGVGAIASKRYPGYNAEQYLTRRLIDPDFSAIPGYPKIMPKVWQPPISLSWPEIKAVVAYLESLGGEVTVKITPDDLLDKPHTVAFPDGAKVTVSPPKPPEKIDPALIKEGHDVMMALPEKERCTACHKIGREEPPGWVATPGTGFCPDLSDIGAMHDITYIEKKINNPQSLPTVTGYPKGMMPMDFDEQLKKLYGNQWHEKLVALASYIVSHNGIEKPMPDVSPWIVGGMLILSTLLGFIVKKGGA
jgi:mono/diheme cytochrome c family protein